MVITLLLCQELKEEKKTRNCSLPCSVLPTNFNKTLWFWGWEKKSWLVKDKSKKKGIISDCSLCCNREICLLCPGAAVRNTGQESFTLLCIHIQLLSSVPFWRGQAEWHSSYIFFPVSQGRIVLFCWVAELCFHSVPWSPVIKHGIHRERNCTVHGKNSRHLWVSCRLSSVSAGCPATESWTHQNDALCLLLYLLVRVTLSLLLATRLLHLFLTFLYFRLDGTLVFLL